MEITDALLEHLHCVLSQIMSPIMSNSQNQSGWSDLLSKNFMTQFSDYQSYVHIILGKIKG